MDEREILRALLDSYIRGEYQKSLQFVEDLLLKNPDDVDYLILKINILYYLGDISSAAKELYKLNRTHSKNPNVRMLNGFFAFSAGDYRLAESQFGMAYRMSGDAEAAFMLALTLYLTGDRKRALLYIRTACRSNRERVLDNISNLSNRVIPTVKDGNQRKAIEEFIEAVESVVSKTT